jgi:hypothetical protein
MLTVATRNMVDAQWSKPGDLAARRLWAYVSHAGSEQDAIQGALADCSRYDHGCRIIAIGPFSVVAAEVGKAP